MISLRLYLPALGGIRLRMSGRLGSMGRMNPGILSYIAWTPDMISFASFSSILVPFRAVFMLLALIFLLTSPGQAISDIYRFFRSRLCPFLDSALNEESARQPSSIVSLFC